MLFVRLDERPSVSAFEACLATFALVVFADPLFAILIFLLPLFLLGTRTTELSTRETRSLGLESPIVVHVDFVAGPT